MEQSKGISRRAVACRMLVALCAGAAATSSRVEATASGVVPTISWGACKAGLVDERWKLALGNRLECGSMLTALDEDVTTSGTFTVGLVRVKAGSPAHRQGTLFFNFGGPGANPLEFLPPTAYLWATRSSDHPLDGDKRRLADRFDLVAVIPRGLRGGTRVACRAATAYMFPHDPTVYLADWNWVGFVKDARAYAEACGANPLQQHVGTLEHVRDMERARLALGAPVMNFVGISYGSWVGAYYAMTYPNHAGRIVLDSVMNYAGTFEEQLDDFPYERQALFARNALRPALVSPLVYGLGTDAKAVMARLRAMPPAARETWAFVIVAPGHLVAALTLADWLRAEPEASSDRLLARVRSYIFSPDARADNEIRSAAMEFALRLNKIDDPTLGGLVDLSVYHAVVCGDTPWRNDIKALRMKANHIGAKYPASNGNNILTALTCANWSTGPRARPLLTALAKAPPMLLVQAEFDPATPHSGAMKAFNASPNAYIVVANGMSEHGVFGSSATPCIEQGVGRFLLSGELPATRFSYCDFIPAPLPREGRDSNEGPTESEVRAEIRRLLRHS